MMRRARTVAAAAGLLALLAAAGPSRAEEPPLRLGLPLACEVGVSCWIPRYVDLDPGPGVRDFACGTLSGPAHSGIDFAVRDLAAMRAGVPVIASADGTVRGLRDGMEDVNVEVIGQAAIEGRNCGNGVALAHAGGWETQYCHLKQGSIAVRQGERVTKGQKLGEVGLSGETSFPHVHLSLRRGQEEIDPFRGLDGGPACGIGAVPLWDEALLPQLAYRPVLLTGIGFAPDRIEADDAREGRAAAPSLPLDAPALVLWMDGYGFRRGDRLHFTITGPDGGTLLDHRAEEERDRARLFRFVGQRRPAGGWQPGRYRGEVVIERPEGGYRTSLAREIRLGP